MRPQLHKSIWILNQECRDLRNEGGPLREGGMVIKNCVWGRVGKVRDVLISSLRLAHPHSRLWITLNIVHCHFLVADPAKVVYSAREMFLPYGRPAMIDCHVRANPPMTAVRWDKDGFLFDPLNVQGVFSRRNGSLFFEKVGTLTLSITHSW